MIKYFFFLLLFFRLAFVFPCDLPDHFDFEVSNNEAVLLYAGCYDAVHKGPHIIDYVLTGERAESTGTQRPSAQFTQNRDGGLLQALLTENGFSLPSHRDYTNSGYDRGHMAPNADFNDTYDNALMTFFIANVWPQLPKVNRSTWLKTENETRRLAIEHQSVHVMIIVDTFTDATINGIQVPEVFKRRVYDMSGENLLYEIDVYQEK